MVWGRSPRAARAFLAALDRAVASALEAPLRWPAGVYGTRRIRLRRFPFGLVYRIGLDEIQVIAVMHLHRRPGYWRNRG
ncbi:MAG: type II toxin-antitoxin system RelE/ParE family toxin [Planctomycetota bacterium]